MDIGEWLRNLGLEQYEAAFRDNEIDDRILATLTAEDLKEIGVAIVGHRRRILTAIAELSEPIVALRRSRGIRPGGERHGRARDTRRRRKAPIDGDVLRPRRLHGSGGAA